VALLSPKFTHWAVGFASSPLVIAYAPESPYATQLKAIAAGKLPLSELFRLMQQPGFHLGRTNPDTDPQGQSFIMMMQLAQRQLKLPVGTADKILGPLNNPAQVFSEEGILARLQAGQLDASSAYLPEAIARHLPYIALPDTLNMGNPADKSLYASEHLTLSNGKTVTGAPIEVYITPVQGTPSPQAGQAFVNFVLSKQGLQLYHDNGYTMTKFILWGDKSMAPPSIQAELQR
jgi:molybdate/tungstate transport system substrate-binding protein